jgi:hypothetical protein
MKTQALSIKCKMIKLNRNKLKKAKSTQKRPFRRNKVVV